MDLILQNLDEALKAKKGKKPRYDLAATILIEVCKELPEVERREIAADVVRTLDTEEFDNFATDFYEIEKLFEEEVKQNMRDQDEETREYEDNALPK